MKTWEEQFGFTLVWAMASGLPIVTTGCGAIPEIVGDHNLIVPEGSLAGVVESLSYLLENASEAKKIGRENRRRTEERFNSDSQARAFEEFLLSRISS